MRRSRAPSIAPGTFFVAQSWADCSTNMDGFNLRQAQESYQPDPIRRVFIPKANGKLRPLGISTVRDRVCMTAAMLVLEPIFEADPPRHRHAITVCASIATIHFPFHSRGAEPQCAAATDLPDLGHTARANTGR
jgi:hypothetical protein